MCIRDREYTVQDNSGNRTLVKFGTGDQIRVEAGESGIRFLLISGSPIQEPVAWHGPIVMNTQSEIAEAVRDLKNNTFIRNQN